MEPINFSPEVVRPFPKAGPRKPGRTVKKKTSEILTDTPVKNALELENMTRKLKGSKKGAALKRSVSVEAAPGQLIQAPNLKKARANQSMTKKVTVKKNKNRNTLPHEESDQVENAETTSSISPIDVNGMSIDNNPVDISLPPNGKGKAVDKTKRKPTRRQIMLNEISDTDDSGDDDILHDGTSDSADDVDMEPSTDSDQEISVRHDKLKPGNYVLVQLRGIKNTFHYVAKVESLISDDLEFDVTYLEKKPTKNDDVEQPKFIIPQSQQTYAVPVEDIIRKLPSPSITGGTKRISRQMTFNYSFSGYNLA